jgi:hypothetical protein
MKDVTLSNQGRHNLKILIFCREVEVVTRDLYAFELELKEYHVQTFEQIKDFINQGVFNPESVINKTIKA